MLPRLVPAAMAMSLVACAGPHQTLRPTRTLGTSADAIRLEIDHVEVGGGESIVAIRVTNDGDEAVRFDPTQVRLVTSETPGRAGEDDASLAGSAVVGTGQAAADVGGAFSGGGGGGAGAIVGVALVAGAVVVVAAIAAGVAVAWIGYVIVDDAVERARRHLEAGESAVFRVVFPGVTLDDPDAALDVGHAIATRSPPAPIPLRDPDAPHDGWGSPGPLDFAFVTRIAGGAIARGDGEPDGITGGIEIWAGPRLGPIALTFGGALLGAGALGSEVRLHLLENDVLSLAAIAGYGWYWLAGGLGIGVGHGPRAGLDFSFAVPTGEEGPLGHPSRPMWMGLFARGGPVWLADQELGVSIDAGFVIGMF